MKASPIHAILIIFLEFWSWGLLTTVVLQVINSTLGKDTLFLNGLIHGIKGILSFLFVPIIGAISDIHGRKKIILLCVSATCFPIPLLLFIIFYVLSGTFGASFPLSFAYISDCTSEKKRDICYGMVSASFAASLIAGPTIGQLILSKTQNNITLVVLLASLIAIINIIFIIYLTPESIDKHSFQEKTPWNKILNPFFVFRHVYYNKYVRFISIITFFSTLVEAGQTSSIFIYLKSVVDLSSEEIASVIAVYGIVAVLSQVIILNILTYFFGPNIALIIGLLCQILELALFGVFLNKKILWVAIIFGSISSLTFPCISSMLARRATSEQIGVFQGLITGIRSICNGLGPALFGTLFHIFKVELSYDMVGVESDYKGPRSNFSYNAGLPYLFGSFIVLIPMIILVNRNKFEKTKH